MKRILIAALAIVMVFALAACTGSDTASPTPDNPDNTPDPNITDPVVPEPDGINGPEDLTGKKVAVQDETTADESLTALQEAGLDVEIIRYPQIINCFDDLNLGRVDAVYVDSVVAAFYTTDSDTFTRVWLSDEAEPLGICLKKGSEELRDAIDAAVDMLYYNGTMAEIAYRHFGNDFEPARTVLSEPTIPEISDDLLRTAGLLSIGCEIGYPPMEYLDTDGRTPIGFDIDVGAAIAELLGLEPLVIDTAWDGIFAGVDRGDYDCIISSVSITPARLEAYLFTQPYVANALCIVVKN